MSKYPQNPVSQTVWPWQDPASGKSDGRPKPATAILGMLAAWCIAGLIYWLTHENHPNKALVMACIIVGISVIICACGLFSAPAYAVVHRILSFITLVVNKVMSVILLVPFFYLAFPMGRISQKLKGKDPMSRPFPTDAKSYWVERPKVTDKAYYKRQS